MLSTPALAKKGALIDYKDGKASAQLAKSWTKVKDGEYSFELDLSKKVKSKAYTAEHVKGTLEAKLAKKYGVKVTVKSPTQVVVNYTGDEGAFLKKLSKTKIKTRKAVTLALESSVSDGAMRANKASPPPQEGEVKGIVVKVRKGFLIVKVNESRFKGIEPSTIRVAPQDGVDKGHAVIFKPGEKVKNVWQPVDGSFKVFK